MQNGSPCSDHMTRISIAEAYHITPLGNVFSAVYIILGTGTF